MLPSSLRYLWVLFPLLLLMSCKKEQMGDCLKGKGERTEEKRSITGVRKIELHDHVDLRIVKSSSEGVEVHAGENLIPLIKTRKKGERLTIRDLNTCHWVRSYDKVPKVVVRTKRLLRLENHSTSDISMKGKLQGKRFHYAQWNGMGEVKLRIDVDSLCLEQHTGSANIQCSGRCETADLYLGGHGFMKLRDLSCRKVWAHNAGSGDMELHVTEELGAKVESLGSIFFEGDGELLEAYDEGDGDIERDP